MGEVYLARDETARTKAALKLLPDNLTTDDNEINWFKNKYLTEPSKKKKQNHQRWKLPGATTRLRLDQPGDGTV